MDKITRFILLSALLLFISVLQTGCDSFRGLFENQEQKVQETYISYFNAMITGDIQSLKKYVSKDKVKELEAPGAGNMLSLARGLYPGESHVTAVKVTGDIATISLAGQSQGASMNGTVNMVKEEGLWKVSKESWEMKMGPGDQPQQQAAPGQEGVAGTQPPQQTSAQPSQQPASGQSPFSKQDPGVSGEALVVKDGQTETFQVRTGFFSDTRMAQPSRATVQFQAAAPEHSNARRIQITLDATKTGEHYADGKLLSDNFMSSDTIRIGERTPQGYTASFRWYNDGGQIFWPKTSCIINITSAYTGSPSSVFAGEVRDCPVHSAGIDYNISSVKFTMRGAPAR